MVSDRVADVLIDKGGEFHHGFTYSGHPVACAVAVRNIRILKEEGIVERVRNGDGAVSSEALARVGGAPVGW